MMLIVGSVCAVVVRVGSGFLLEVAGARLVVLKLVVSFAAGQLAGVWGMM